MAKQAKTVETAASVEPTEPRVVTPEDMITVKLTRPDGTSIVFTRPAIHVLESYGTKYPVPVYLCSKMELEHHWDYGFRAMYDGATTIPKEKRDKNGNVTFTPDPADVAKALEIRSLKIAGKILKYTGQLEGKTVPGARVDAVAKELQAAILTWAKIENKGTVPPMGHTLESTKAVALQLGASEAGLETAVERAKAAVESRTAPTLSM